MDYEATTKAIFNLDRIANGGVSNMKIGTSYNISDDSKVADVPKITAIRAGRVNNDIANPASSRNLYENVFICGVHTGFDLTGWVIDLPAIFMQHCKYGIIASEWNNVEADLHFELVVKPLSIYIAHQVNINSFLNEGGLTFVPSTLDGCRSFSINGLYLEGGTTDTTMFDIGKGTTVDADISYTIDCRNVTFNDVTIAMYLEENKAFVGLDFVAGFTMNGSANNHAYYTKTFFYTENTVDVDTGGFYNRNQLTQQLPLQIMPNNKFKYESSGYKIESQNDTDVSYVYKNNNISTITDGKLLKIVCNTDDSTDANFKLEMNTKEKKELRDYFSIGDTVMFGAWIYVPKQAYEENTTNNRPFFVVRGGNIDEGDITDLGFMEVTAFDEWVFCYSDVVLENDIDYLYFNFYMSNSIAVPLDTYMLVDSIYCATNKLMKKKFIAGQFDSECPFGKDMGTYYKHIRHNSTHVDNYDFYGIKGDRIDNPDVTAGAFKELELSQYDKFRYSGQPITAPNIADIPTSNNGVGTIWSDSNVLTLGS